MDAHTIAALKADGMINAHEIAKKLTKARRDDLTTNWDAFCDCDWHDMSCEVDGFAERLEAVGLTEFVAVDDDALEDSFAAERGIYPGGSMWQLTPLGLEVRNILLNGEGK